MSFDEIPQLLDQPDALWGTQWRYVEAGQVQSMARPASLYFVQPESIGPLRVWSELATDAQGHQFDRHRRRVTLRYRGAFHEFDITDPQLQTCYYPKPPGRSDPALNVPLRDAAHTAVCVSLTPVWQGRHYKIAAAFVEPPAGNGNVKP
jgi:hypothetical protein